MNAEQKRPLVAFCFFVAMIGFDLAATFGGYRLGVGSSDLDGTANTIAGVVMILIGLNEGRRHLRALLGERWA